VVTSGTEDAIVAGVRCGDDAVFAQVLTYWSRAMFERHIVVCAGCETDLQQMKESALRRGGIPVERLSVEMQMSLLSPSVPSTADPPAHACRI